MNGEVAEIQMCAVAEGFFFYAFEQLLFMLLALA
jgi:hypothetical protein